MMGCMQVKLNENEDNLETGHKQAEWEQIFSFLVPSNREVDVNKNSQPYAKFIFLNIFIDIVLMKLQVFQMLRDALPFLMDEKLMNNVMRMNWKVFHVKQIMFVSNILEMIPIFKILFFIILDVLNFQIMVQIKDKQNWDSQWEEIQQQCKNKVYNPDTKAFYRNSIIASVYTFPVILVLVGKYLSYLSSLIFVIFITGKTPTYINNQRFSKFSLEKKIFLSMQSMMPDNLQVAFDITFNNIIISHSLDVNMNIIIVGIIAVFQLLLVYWKYSCQHKVEEFQEKYEVVPLNMKDAESLLNFSCFTCNKNTFNIVIGLTSITQSTHLLLRLMMEGIQSQTNTRNLITIINGIVKVNVEPEEDMRFLNYIQRDGHGLDDLGFKQKENELAIKQKIRELDNLIDTI